MSSPVRFHPHHSASTAVRPLAAERLYELLGREVDVQEFVRVLRHYVQDARPPVVGAHQVTCSDEAEQECVDAFHRDFVHYLLPSQKFFSKAAFRSANLGARYEWGSVRIAENHYAMAKGADDWKLMVVKINAHVSVADTPEGPKYGQMQRYDHQSVYCGALAGLLAGSHGPWIDDLVTAFTFDGPARLHALRESIDPKRRSLFAAVASARLQARRATLDIQDYSPDSPTLYLVLPCVTFNRAGHDTELLCGIYTLDRRTDEPHDEYCGLEDRPEAYRLRSEGPRVVIEDAGQCVPRLARDHRALLRAAAVSARAATAAPTALEALLRDASIERKHAAHPHLASAVAKTALGLLIEATPVPAALLLFGEGWIHIHRAAQAHRLANEAEGDAVAREMLAELRERVDSLSHEEALHLIELLSREYGK